jgi:hypothetical protein
MNLKINRSIFCLFLALCGVSAGLAQDFTKTELEKMVAELDAVSTRNPKYLYPIKCSVVEDDEVNAFASIEKMPKEGEIPQAIMVVNSGLVKFAKGDRRLIRAVVAHEVSHLMQGHVLAPKFVAQDLRHLWTRQQEMDADLTGSKLLERAGYKKQDMIDMLFMLDKLEVDSGWMWKLSKNDHTSAKNRAAEVAGNPDVMKSMMAWEKGMAFFECRYYRLAGTLFTKAYQQEPKFTESLVNAAQASLMDYYDSLPKGVQDKWFIPDFGPVLTDNPIAGNRGDDFTDDDRARFKLATQRIADAKAKRPTDARVSEMEMLAGAIAPDATKDSLLAVGDKLATLGKSGSNYDRIRFANNAGMAFHRADNLQKSYDTIVGVLKDTKQFSYYLAQNLGRFQVNDRPKEEELLVLDVMVQWLKNTPEANSYYKIVLDAYNKGCTTAGVKAEEVKAKPAYLCKVAGITIKGKQAPILVETNDYVDYFGAPASKLKISDQFPDVQFWVWNGGEVSVLTERGAVARVSSNAIGSYIDLRPKDPTVNIAYRIIVGMKEEDFSDILDLSKSVERKVVGVSGIETWNFFPNMLLGVQRKDGRIVGVTVSPVHEDEG